MFCFSTFFTIAIFHPQNSRPAVFPGKPEASPGVGVVVTKSHLTSMFHASAPQMMKSPTLPADLDPIVSWAMNSPFFLWFMCCCGCFIIIYGILLILLSVRANLMVLFATKARENTLNSR